MIGASSFVGFETKTVIAATSGPLSPGTITSPSTGFGYYTGLSNPDNMKVSDNTYASYDTVTTNISWHATNFGFSIPTGSTINGILFEIERKSLYGDSITDSVVKVIKANGTLGSTSKHTGTSWASSDQYDSFGGAADLWSETWTAEDINDADFGIFFVSYGYEASMRIDHIRCTVYYTLSSPSDLTFGSRYTYTTPGGGAQALYNASASLDSTHFVVAWRDANDADQGKIVVGTVSGSSISYGSIVTFNAGDTRNPQIAKIDSTHFAIVFRDSGDSGKGKAMIGTVSSGNVITFGSEYTFASGTVNNPDVSLLDSTHIAVTYDDVTNTDGSAIVGTISSTDVITFGTRVAYSTASISGSRIATLDSTHFAILYRDETPNVLKSIIGVVSGGTTITYGSAVSVLADATNSRDIVPIDSTHFLVGYTDNTAGVASGNVGTVTSGNVISIGTKYSSVTNLNEIVIGTFSATDFYFVGITSGAPLNALTGTISGSVLTYDDYVTADSGTNGYVGASTLSATSMVVTYSNTDGSPIGAAKIGSLPSPTPAGPTLIINLKPSTQIMKINTINYSTIKKINLITSN